MTIDLQQVLREIDDEVEARRASGDFPPGMERDLDLVFARFAPVGVSGDDLDAIVQAAERASFFDPTPPTESRIPAVGYLKKTERKLLGWWFRYLSHQVTTFATATVEGLRHLGRRVVALEAATPGAIPELRATALDHEPAIIPDLRDEAVRHLAGGGRTLVADSGDGSVIDALRITGTDAYGVDPRADKVEAASRRGLDVRADEVVDHLRAVDAGVLAGVLLTGCVERLPVGFLLALVDAAAAALGDDGRLALVSASPSVHIADDPVLADLSPGRPLHAETWVHLLQTRGFAEVVVHRSVPKASADPGDRLAVLERAVFGDGPYAVTATRRR